MPNPIVDKPGEIFGHPVELDAASATRRLALRGTRLAVPLTPFVDEGFADLLQRAAQRNGEYHLAGMLRILNSKLTKVAFYPHSLIDFTASDEAIADFLGTPRGAEDIARLRCRRVREGVVSFFGTHIKTAHLANHRRVSPRSLAAKGYQKAIWSVLPIGFDPENHEILLDHCPACGVTLSFEKTYGMCFCHLCFDDNKRSPSVDLRDWKQAIVQLDSFENIDLACSLIDPLLSLSLDRLGSFHPDLRSLSRGQVFEFIILIARLLQRAKGESLEGAVPSEDLDAATAAVRKWPNGVIEIGEKVTHVWRQTYSHGRDFSHPIYREVHSYPALFGTDFARLVRSQLRANKEASESSVQSTLPKSPVGPRAKPAKIGGFDSQDPEDRLALGTLLARNSASVRKEARVTGLPIVELATLYNAGVWKCPDTRLASFFETSSTGAGLLSELEGRSTTLNGQTWPLYETVTALSRGGIIWTDILREILACNLAVQVDSGDTALVGRMRIANIEVIRSIAAKCHDRSVATVVMPYVEAGFYLGFGATPRTAAREIARLVAAGLLPPKTIRYSDIRSFLTRFVTGHECLHRLRLNEHEVGVPWRTYRGLHDYGIALANRKPAVLDRSKFESYLTGHGYQ